MSEEISVDDGRAKKKARTNKSKVRDTFTDATKHIKTDNVAAYQSLLKEDRRLTKIGNFNDRKTKEGQKDMTEDELQRKANETCEANHIPAKSTLKDTPYAKEPYKITEAVLTAHALPYSIHQMQMSCIGTTGSGHYAKKLQNIENTLLKGGKMGEAIKIDILQSYSMCTSHPTYLHAESGNFPKSLRGTNAENFIAPRGCIETFEPASYTYEEDLHAVVDDHKTRLKTLKVEEATELHNAINSFTKKWEDINENLNNIDQKRKNEEAQIEWRNFALKEIDNIITKNHNDEILKVTDINGWEPVYTEGKKFLMYAGEREDDGYTVLDITGGIAAITNTWK